MTKIQKIGDAFFVACSRREFLNLPDPEKNEKSINKWLDDVLALNGCIHNDPYFPCPVYLYSNYMRIGRVSKTWESESNDCCFVETEDGSLYYIDVESYADLSKSGIEW